MASTLSSCHRDDSGSSAAAALAQASFLLSGGSDHVSNELNNLRSLLERTEMQATRAVRCTEMKSSSEIPLRDELAQARCEAAMWRLRAQAAQGECSVARVAEASLQRRLEQLEFSASFHGGKTLGNSGGNFSTDVELEVGKRQNQVSQEVAQLRQQLCARDMELDATKAAHVLSRTEAEAREVWVKQQAQMELSAHAALIEAERTIYERRLAELESNSEDFREEISRQAKDCAAAFDEMQAGFALMLDEAETLSDEHRDVLRKLIDLSRRKVLAYVGQPVFLRQAEATNLCVQSPSAAATVALSHQPAPGVMRGANLACTAVTSVVERPTRTISPPPQLRRAMPRPVHPVHQVVQVCPMPVPAMNLNTPVVARAGMPRQVVSTTKKSKCCEC